MDLAYYVSDTKYVGVSLYECSSLMGSAGHCDHCLSWKHSAGRKNRCKGAPAGVYVWHESCPALSVRDMMSTGTTGLYVQLADDLPRWDTSRGPCLVVLCLSAS